MMALIQETVRGALRNAAKAAHADPKADWTTRILRALAALADEGCCVDPNVHATRRGHGRTANEYLWDLTISSWPDYKSTPYEYPGYFSKAGKSGLTRPLELLLVAESEWGDESNRRENGMAVMDDFLKLLGARAPLKVMVFGYFEKPGRFEDVSSSFDELTGHMKALIYGCRDEATYVLFGVAWDHAKYRDVAVAGGSVSDEFCGP